MRRTNNNEESKRIWNDLDVVLKSHDCPFIVQCLGYFITDADVWICMELMETCFDKLTRKSNQPVPENILGKVTVAVMSTIPPISMHTFTAFRKPNRFFSKHFVSNRR